MRLRTFIKNAVASICLAGGLAVLSSQSHAQDIPFQGTVETPNFCTIFIRNNGTLAQNPDGSVLSSKLPGGQSAVADVRSFGNYQVTAQHSQFWNTSPIPSHAETTFEPTFSGVSLFNGVNFSEQAGNVPVFLRFFSFTRMTIDLVATHNTASFPVGDYTSQVSLICE